MADASAVKIQAWMRGAHCRKRHDAAALLELQKRRFEELVEEQLTSCGVRLLRHFSSGPPRPCIARIGQSGDFRMMTLDSYRCGLSVCEKRTEEVDLSSCNLVVAGRVSANLRRGRKFILLENERMNDAAFSLYECPSGALDSSARSLVDLQVPPSPSAWARRRMLVQALAARLGCAAGRPDDVIPPDLPDGHPGWAFKVVKSAWFNLLIFACVVVSVVTLAATDPAWALDEAHRDNEALNAFSVIDRATAVVFTFEALLKMYALESIGVYLKDPWNALDLFVVTTGWITQIFPNLAGSTSLNLTALRTLRVLRTMKYLSGVREIVETFTRTMSMVLQGLFIYAYFLLLFAMLGREAWDDALSHQCVTNSTPLTPTRYCSVPISAGPNSSSSFILACPDARTRCASAVHLDGGFTGFHEASTAVFTVFKLSSRSSMGVVLQGLMQTRSSAAILYALALTLFLSLMVFALFVAIVRGTFTSVRASARPRSGSSTSLFFSVCRRKIRVYPRGDSSSGKVEREEKALQKWCRKVVDFRWWQAVVLCAIVANIVMLGMESHQQSAEKTAVLEAAEVVFLCMFAVELVLNVGAAGGVRGYLFASEDWLWNQLDAGIVVCSLLDLCLSRAAQGPSINLSFLRFFRLFRVLKLLRRWPQVLRIMQGMRRSLPGLSNLMLFWLLVVVVFAILGMQLYGAKFEPGRSNFDDFPTAVMTLFKMMTGGALWQVFHSALEVQGGVITPLFFVGYSVLTVYVTLNFMIVIIMSNFAMSKEEIETQRVVLKKKLYRQIEQQRPKKRGILRLLPPLQPELMDEEESLMALLAGQIRARASCVSPERLDYSLLLFSEESCVRSAAQEVTTHPLFEATVFIAIIASSILLALDSPLNSRDPMYQTSTFFAVLRYGDIIFLTVFSGEFVVKVLAQGLLLPRHGFLRSGWNQLDLAVLLVTLLGMLQAQGSTGRILRMLRVLRPLRMVSHNEGLRVIVDALFSSIKPVGYTLVLILCFFFIYAILGIYLFVGQFWKCNDERVQSRDACVGQFISPDDHLLRPRVWQAPPFGYDDIMQGMMTLFETISLKAWTEKLDAASDVAGVFQQPRIFNAPIPAALFHICFIFIGNFFLMKLFVGIVVGTFRQFSGNALLTPSQVRWLKVKKSLKKLRPAFASHPGYSRVRRFAVSCCILTHILLTLLCLHSHPEALRIAHWCFAAVYLADMFLGMHERGVGIYLMASKWHIFDLLTTVIFIALPIAGAYEGAAFVKGLNFTRLTALMPRADGIGRIVHVLSDCLVPMCNVTAIMFTFVFIYAVLGMQLFAGVKRGAVLGSVASFDDFNSAILTLFQIISGDNWILLMRDCSVHPPYCVPGFDCGSPAAARTYFYLFYLLVFGLFANLYMATIIDLYVISAVPDTATSAAFSSKMMDRFQRTWAAFDTCRTKRLAWASVEPFIRELGRPMAPDPVEEKSRWKELKSELEAACKIAYACTLPSGELSAKGTPSVGFSDFIGILARSNIPQAWLSEAEKIELEERKRIHILSTHVTKVQSRMRGMSVRREIHKRHGFSFSTSSKGIVTTPYIKSPSQHAGATKELGTPEASEEIVSRS